MVDEFFSHAGKKNENIPDTKLNFCPTQKPCFCLKQDENH